jgi:ornithine--oxo-acid transaminase
VCERLLDGGLLVKDAHDVTVRIAPPLVIEHDELAWGLERLADGLAGAGSG